MHFFYNNMRMTIDIVEQKIIIYTNTACLLLTSKHNCILNVTDDEVYVKAVHTTI